MQIIYIGSDHGGYELKKKIIKQFESQYKFIDLGCENPQSCDYPLFGKKIAEAVVGEKSTLGIALCGSGIGISIAANKVKGARAAHCNSQALAKLSREHNGANILALGARTEFIDPWEKIIKTFLETPLDKSERHVRRRAQLDSF